MTPAPTVSPAQAARAASRERARRRAEARAEIRAQLASVRHSTARSGGNAALGFFVGAVFVRLFGLGVFSALWRTLSKPEQQVYDPQQKKWVTVKEHVNWDALMAQGQRFLLADTLLALSVGAVEWAQRGAGKFYGGVLLGLMALNDWRAVEHELNALFSYRKWERGEQPPAVETSRRPLSYRPGHSLPQSSLPPGVWPDLTRYLKAGVPRYSGGGALRRRTPD